MQVENTLREQGVLVAVAVADGVAVRAAGPALKQALDELIARRQQEEFPPPAIKDGVRNLLKIGGFKPSGRNKPASEYLAQAAREGRFPKINNLVDINNLVSLSSGLPISLLDCAAIGPTLSIRFGREGERYVFNAGGQEIDLNGLICACSAEHDLPLGNAVKDSMTGKIKDHTSAVAAVIYAPVAAEFASLAEEHLHQFADWLRKDAGASSVETYIACG